MEKLQVCDSPSVALLGGGHHVDFRAVRVLGKAERAVHVAQAEVVLGSGVIPNRGFLPPRHRQSVVLIHALAFLAEEAEETLRSDVPLVGSPADPRRRERVVLIHALALVVATAEVVLGARVLLRGGLALPPHRCHPVLLQPLPPVEEEEGELVLVLRLALPLSGPAQLLPVLGGRHRDTLLQIHRGATRSTAV